MLKIRGVDVVWLFFLIALVAVGLIRDEHSPVAWVALLALGVIQIAEGRLGWAESKSRTLLAIAAKLGVCYLMVWATGGIESSYYLLFLLPIVSGASLLGLGETLVLTGVTAALYLSFLLYVLESYYVPPDGQAELTIRVLFFFLGAILVNRLATENRLKTERLEEAYRDLSHAQAEVRRSERLAALGQLSAGLAHEIRNPLGIISASAELLSSNVSEENAVAREVAGFIRSEVNRTNSLVTRFLDFARPSQLDRRVQDLNEVVERAVRQLLDGADGDAPPIEIRKELRPLPPFAFDATLIESSLLNLLLNGREAMPEGGVLRVSTARAGRRARIEVEDRGVGIPEKEIEDVFNPFFTTKPHGVGLGLAMVSKFVDSHGGQITLSSEVGRGTRFTIELPMDETSS